MKNDVAGILPFLSDKLKSEGVEFFEIKNEKGVITLRLDRLISLGLVRELEKLAAPFQLKTEALPAEEIHALNFDRTMLAELNLKSASQAFEDSVNHPKHYNKGNIEVIEFIHDQGLARGFCLGNAIKYTARAGSKDPAKESEDLAKAIWYLRYFKELVDAEKEGRKPFRPNDMPKL